MDDNFIAKRNWPPGIDRDRLDAAFSALNTLGILALHNLPCCDTCAGAYIWSVAVPEAERAGRDVCGYAFYNEQTSDAVIQGGNLVVVCGPIPEPEGREFRSAGKKVVSLVKRELKGQGLSPSHTSNEFALRLRLNLKLSSSA